jgi:hypothetical protein
MDIRVYYQKVRQAEASIATDSVFVVSVETPDGVKAGVKTEVPRQTAAKLMVEGKARLATEGEEAQYDAEQQEQRRRAEEADAGGKVQVTLLSEADIRAMKTGKSLKS